MLNPIAAGARPEDPGVLRSRPRPSVFDRPGSGDRGGREDEDGAHRTRRDAARRHSAEGQAHRRDPELRVAGDAHRHRHRQRRRGRDRLQLYDRDRRLVGDAPARRPPRAAPPRQGRRAGRGDLARTRFRDPRHDDWRDLGAGARGDRHGVVGPALQAARAAALDCRRRRVGPASALHHRRRVAAHR